jgi:hypothetical protein
MCDGVDSKDARCGNQHKDEARMHEKIQAPSTKHQPVAQLIFFRRTGNIVDACSLIARRSKRTI